MKAHDRYPAHVRSRTFRNPPVRGVLSIVALLILTTTTRADLTHLYNFNNGTATDLIGHANGTFFGATSIVNGQLNLPGGGTGITGDHLRLLADGPDGINIAGYTNASFELWATAADTDRWARYFDFGGRSIFGPNAAGNAIFLTVNAQQNSSLRATISNVNINTQTGNLNEDQASATAAAIPLTGPNGVLGTQRHIVVTFNGAANDMRIYYEGNLAVQNAATDNMLELLQEDYALLGASLYGNDPSFNGAINEFRIYNHVLTPTQIAANFAAGPTVPEPAGPLLLFAGGLCLILQRKRNARKNRNGTT